MKTPRAIERKNSLSRIENIVRTILFLAGTAHQRQGQNEQERERALLFLIIDAHGKFMK